ncbi:aquaporin AQPAe.a isoform X2 [Leptinotarsa decemlineata]|uniref:aquaporin AQPAe.a isoform X2 n=1 Tax=Leptinotarsa decemlineata TaxID=7539 RepID=UPI000C251A19|nr:aquaporin AQPAe.a-like [Leptinotarsa decemlineata]
MVKGKKIQVMDNMTTKDRVILCASEVGGTFILVFLGCMGCVSGIAGGSIPHEQISFTFGLAVMVAVQVFGHISGSHINPIVTVAAAVLGNISLIQVPILIVGQFLGAILGFGLLMAVTPENLMGNVYHNVSGEMVKQGVGVCSPMVNHAITPAQGLLVEFLISLILVLTCCGVWDARNSDKHDSVPIRFGLMIAVLAMAGGPYTGANMNPARSFAPALMNGDWKDHWVYWVGPLAAGFFGALLYRLIFTKEVPSSKETIPEAIALTQKP